MTSPAICPHCLTEVPISSHSYEVASDDFRDSATDQSAAARGTSAAENQQASSPNESNTTPALYTCPGCGTQFSIDDLDATDPNSDALHVADNNTSNPSSQSSIHDGAEIPTSNAQGTGDDDDEFELSDLDLDLELDPIPEANAPVANAPVIDIEALEIEDVVAQSEPNDTPIGDSANSEEEFILDESFAIDDESLPTSSELLNADGYSDSETELDTESDGDNEEPRPLIVFSVDDHSEDEIAIPRVVDRAVNQTTNLEIDIETAHEPIETQTIGDDWSSDDLTSDRGVTNDSHENAATDAIATASENDLEIEDVVSDIDPSADDVAVIDEHDINESEIETELEVEALVDSDSEGSTTSEELAAESVEVESTQAEPVAETNPWELINAAARPRPKRREVSPIRKIVPPILGGLAAFPIATLIMWYGFGKDIGSAGPTVARYAPWIVPQHLRGKGQRFSTAPSKPAASPNESNSSKGSGSTPRRNGTFGELGSNNNGSSNNSKPAPAASSSKSPQSSAVNKVSEPNEAKPLTATKEPQTDSDPTVPEVDTAIASTDRDNSEMPKLSESLANKTPSTPAETIDPEPDNALIPKAIQTIRDLKAGWSALEKSSQQEKQAAVETLFTASRTIAEASSELRGRSGKVWRKEIDKSGKEILATPIFQKAIDMCSTGLIKGITPPKKGEFATFIANVASFEINADGQLALKLSRPLWVGTNQVIPKLLPESTSSTPVPTITSPTPCLLLGKLVEMTDDESEASSPENEKRWVLEVHLIVWPQ